MEEKDEHEGSETQAWKCGYGHEGLKRRDKGSFSHRSGRGELEPKHWKLDPYPLKRSIRTGALPLCRDGR